MKNSIEKLNIKLENVGFLASTQPTFTTLTNLKDYEERLANGEIKW